MKTKREISDKAYNDFSSRINETLNIVCADAAAYDEAISMLDNYVSGKTFDESCISACCEKSRIAFMMIRPEIDKAIKRSRSARERAKRRKESASIEKTDRSKSAGDTNMPGSVEQPDSQGMSAFLKLFGLDELPDEADDSDSDSDSLEPLRLSRRERRAKEQELARSRRRHARKLRRERSSR